MPRGGRGRGGGGRGGGAQWLACLLPFLCRNILVRGQFDKLRKQSKYCYAF